MEKKFEMNLLNAEEMQEMQGGNRPNPGDPLWDGTVMCALREVTCDNIFKFCTDDSWHSSHCLDGRFSIGAPPPPPPGIVLPPSTSIPVGSPELAVLLP